MPPEYNESQNIFSAESHKMLAGDVTPDEVLSKSAAEFQALLDVR